MILNALVDHDNQAHPFFDALLSHLGDGDVDVAVVLVKLADAVEILLQLRLVQPAGLVEERDRRYRLGFHLVPQDAIAEFGVALEHNRADRAFFAFVDRVNRAGRAVAFIRHELQLHVDAGESFALIKIDDVLAAFLELFRVRRRWHPELDLAAHLAGFETRGTVDFDLRYQRPGGKNNLDADAVAGRFAKDADVLDLARVIKRPDIVFHRRLGIWLADFRAHIGENTVLGNGFGPDVAHVDRGDRCAFHALSARPRRQPERPSLTKGKPPRSGETRSGFFIDKRAVVRQLSVLNRRIRWVMRVATSRQE